MINQQTYGAATEEDYYTSADRGFSYTAQDVRSGFEDFIRVNFDETGFMSQAEMADQRQYVERVLATASPESQEFADLVSAYTGTFAEQSKSKNRNIYHSGVVGPLKNAVDSHIISANSYREWIDWIRDPSRSAAEKKASIAKALPDYLGTRRALGAKRQAVLRDKSFKALENSQDPNLKSLAAKISDNDYFLDTLSLKEREDLVVEVQNALPLAEEDVALFASFSANLDACVSDGVLTEASKKKWIGRFKDPSISPKARAYFVNSQFPSYVKGWRKVAADRTEMMSDPLFKELTEDDVKDINTFKDDKKFIGLHFDKKTNFNLLVKNALIAKKIGNETWHKEVRGSLETAAAAGYVSKNRIGSLIDRMHKRGRTVKEVRDFIKVWAKIRHRYDQVELKMTGGKVPQGFNRLSEEKFLMLSSEQRESYVAEAESRLRMEKSSPTNTPIQDLKGKVRHALDSEDWDQARMFLKDAWAAATKEEDMVELRSMERHLKNFGSQQQETPEQDKMSAMRSAIDKIDSAMTQVPDEVKPFYREAFKKGNAGCVRCLGVLLYNVHWCLERGYLPQDLTKAKERAQADTAMRMEPAGPSHRDGNLEFNDVEGHGNAALREGQWGPNVICAGSSDASRVIESADANKNSFAYWYWGDLVVDGVSSGQYAKLGTETRRAITSGCYALEALGESYHSAKDKLGMITSENAHKYN